YIFRERSLYYSRIQDIIKLCELREYDLKGHRELILFLYRYYQCSFTEDPQKALEDVLSLNSTFRQPLNEREVIRATKSAETCYLSKNKEYRYRNDTLIDLLEITEKEQIDMITIISKEEYKKRDNERNKRNYRKNLKLKGKLTKKQQLEEIREKIKSLRNKGFKNKDICKELDLAESTLKRHITYMKNNGLIK
ncbi:MAG: DNA-binding response regulator, partial [Clostridium sp.]|nr:DNA-binding response regulator [Clostridium sp.]